jgi:hypothetical protein
MLRRFEVSYPTVSPPLKPIDKIISPPSKLTDKMSSSPQNETGFHSSSDVDEIYFDEDQNSGKLKSKSQTIELFSSVLGLQVGTSE